MILVTYNTKLTVIINSMWNKIPFQKEIGVAWLLMTISWAVWEMKCFVLVLLACQMIHIKANLLSVDLVVPPPGVTCLGYLDWLIKLIM